MLAAGLTDGLAGGLGRRMARWLACAMTAGTFGRLGYRLMGGCAGA